MRVVVLLIAVVSAFTGALLSRREPPVLLESENADIALFV